MTFYLLLLTVLFSLQSLFCKLFSDNAKCKNPAAVPVLFTVLYGSFIALSTLVFAGFRFSASPETVYFGLANGMMLFLYNLSLIKASSQGSYAFTMIAALFGGVTLPIVSMAALWSERLGALQWAGIAVMLVSFVVINAGFLSLKGAKPSFFLWCACLFAANGMYGVLMSSQQLVFDGKERNEMVIVTFAAAALIAALFLLCTQRRDTLRCFRVGAKSGAYAAVCCCVASAAANLMVFLLSRMSVSVMNAVTNGGTLALSVLYSFLFFKEKPAPARTCGIALALAGIVMLSV